MMRAVFDLIIVDSRGTAWCVDSAGQDGRRARAAATAAREAAAIEAMKVQATAPADCGPNIIVSPARGAMRAFMPYRCEITEAGPRYRKDGYIDGDTGIQYRAAHELDAFDEMERQARRAWDRVNSCRPEQDRARFVPPFSNGQVMIARDYAALTERVAASGMRCASLEALRNQGGGTGDREEAILRDARQLRVFHTRIGSGLAKQVRRIRPGADKRRAIRTRDLVDQVCIGGMTLSDVLRAAGWSVDAKSRDALRVDLVAALERMRGYDLVRP